MTRSLGVYIHGLPRAGYIEVRKSVGEKSAVYAPLEGVAAWFRGANCAHSPLFPEEDLTLHTSCSTRGTEMSSGVCGSSGPPCQSVVVSVSASAVGGYARLSTRHAFLKELPQRFGLGSCNAWPLNVFPSSR